MQTNYNDEFQRDSVRMTMDRLRVWPQHILVVHDDLDIPLGQHKLQLGKGPHQHNGLLSIEKRLGTNKFWRLRIGIEARDVKGNKGIPGMQYSLQNFDTPEQKLIHTTISSTLAEYFKL